MAYTLKNMMRSEREKFLHQLSDKIIEVDDDPIHSFFGLTYAHYLVLPRSILQSMPKKWQRDFVKLLEQLDDTGIETPDYQVNAKDKNGKFIKDPYREYWRYGQRCQGLRNVFEEQENE